MYIASKEGENMHEVFSSIVDTLPDKGINRYIISGDQILGLKRGDTDPNIHPAETLAAMRSEGNLLYDEDIIELDEHRRFVVFNMVAASPHTVLRVPYNTFAEKWEATMQENGMSRSTKAEYFIKGADSTDTEILPPNYAPLDMLVNVIMEEDYVEDGEKKTRLIPVDFGDICSSTSNEPQIDKFRLGLQDNDAKLRELFTAYYKRNKVAVQFYCNLFNTVIRKAYAEDPDFPLMIPEISEAYILQAVGSGYYRGDLIKELLQFDYDHLGKGTQSLVFLHNRDITHLTLGMIREIAELNHMTFEEVIQILKRKPDFFGEDIQYEEVFEEDSDGNKKVKKDLFQRMPITDIQKIIDVYSKKAHVRAAPWMELKLGDEKYFNGAQIESFDHHSTEDGEIRSSQGVKISVPCTEAEADETAVEMLMRAGKFIGQELYPLWEDAKRYTKYKVIMSHEERKVELGRMQERYQLPDEMIQGISALLPTERQLQNLKKCRQDYPENVWRINHMLERYNKRKKQMYAEKQVLEHKVDTGDATSEDLVDLLYTAQYMHIFDDMEVEGSDKKVRLNHGYNIPGVPSFCITYFYDKDAQAYNMIIGWTLSMKGVSEHELGAPLKRQEAKV